ncbi:heterogeneous nuclear ribonucleoprotein U-like isoform X7 [Macrobrachium rosenbergii]|uniref:heterogeneous nuclear ribonucleoprotein U-like isoform X7 n=1 Tax=Macrobrachium rosenbergii TaxID=79674 RepID=UPI0034D66ED8
MDHLHYTGNTKKTCGSKGTECSAMNCTKYTKTNKEVAFHSFPKDDARCAEWIRNLRREDLLGKTPDQMKWRRVCSDHFATSQFKNPNDRKSGLLPNSIPWLIDCPDPPKSGDVRRKQPHDRGRSAPVEGRDSSSMNEVKKELGNGCDGSMKIEEIYIKEELIEPEQEPSNTEDRRGEKRRAHSRSRSPDSKKQRPEVEEARVEDKPEYDRSKVLLDCYAGDFELEPDHDEQYEEEEEDPDAPDPDSARENEPSLELEPGQVKEELGNEYDSFMYSEEIDIKEELIEPKQEPSHTEDIQGEKRRAHSRSCSPDSKKQRPEVEEVRVEDEPEYDKSAVLLDWYNRDLSLIIDKETFLSAKPMTSDGSAYVWHGVRARYGFLHGHLFYEVKVEDHLAVPHLEGEQHPYGLRCGWSIGDAEMTLGEEPFSYGYGGTAEASTNLKFKDYGQPLKKGDVIGCFLDMDSRPITMSFSVNGRNFGKCYEVFHRSLRGKALFPHILTKNCAFKVNFGSEYPWFQPMARYTFVGQIPLEERVLGSQEPQTRQDSEISNMNPSSFYGHGYEAGIPDESEDENLESENDDDEYEPEKDSEIQISEDETEDDEGTEEEDYPSTCTKGKKISRKPVWKTKKSEHVDSLEKDFIGQVYAGDGSVRSPIEYFEELLDSSMKKLLVEESNKYAIQNDPNKPLNLTMDELEKFIGMLYIMSIVKIPRARLYWSSYLRFPKIADVMSLQRFETIKKNLHCNDNQSRPDGCQDKLYKI